MNIKKIFIHSKSCHNRYMNYLTQHGIQENLTQESQAANLTLTLRFIPLSNATRWNSWFNMAFYIYDYLEYIRGFYKEEQQKEKTEIIDTINAIFDDQNSNAYIEIYLAFIRYQAQQFISDLNFFQSECDPLFSFI